jgi:hypothetical protein
VETLLKHSGVFLRGKCFILNMLCFCLNMLNVFGEKVFLKGSMCF